ncbi:MAG: hypothetical protein WCR52_02980 [Bacteroidota bacterium]
MKTSLTQKHRLLCLGLACCTLFTLSACHPDSAGVDIGYKLAKLGSNALSISSKLNTEQGEPSASKALGAPVSPGQNVISVHN